jgi:PhnB protein
MKTVTTYLTFNGNCRQAMAFYQQCTGAELQLTAWPDAQGKPSTDPKAGIMHSRLTSGSAPFRRATTSPSPSAANRPKKASASSRPSARAAK